MEYIASLSYGKDSIYMLEVIKQNNMPLDRIITCDIMATNTIYADLPPMIEFKVKADKIILDRYGIRVEHIKSKYSYEDYFYKILGKRAKLKNQGKIYGFPFQIGAWCNYRLKVAPLNKVCKNNISYIGIAVEEKKRYKILNDNKISPLVLHNITENQCLNWCKDNNLLSPIYNSFITRGGCWFCHNQKIGELRQLYHNYPELWKLMLKWDNDSPVSFKPDGTTIQDLSDLFKFQDKQRTMFDTN